MWKYILIQSNKGAVRARCQDHKVCMSRGEHNLSALASVGLTQKQTLQESGLTSVFKAVTARNPLKDRPVQKLPLLVSGAGESGGSQTLGSFRITQRASSSSTDPRASHSGGQGWNPRTCMFINSYLMLRLSRGLEVVQYCRVRTIDQVSMSRTQ